MIERYYDVRGIYTCMETIENIEIRAGFLFSLSAYVDLSSQKKIF